jgi:hypothetical protein
LPFFLSLIGLLPWSPINCWHYDVDIHSGRIRYTRYFAFIRISQHIDESALSRALQRDELQRAHPKWKRALTFSPGVHNSPHYVFHSAISQIRELELIWRLGEYTPSARRSSAKRLLELWQQGQSDDAAKQYLREIADNALPLSSERKSTDVEDE